MHDLLDLRVGEGLDLVLEAAKGVEGGGGKQVRPRGEELPELHERRAQALEVRGELGGIGTPAPRGGSVGPFGRYEPELPVLQRERRDVLVTLEVPGPERQRHLAEIPSLGRRNARCAPRG